MIPNKNATFSENNLLNNLTNYYYNNLNNLLNSLFIHK